MNSRNDLEFASIVQAVAGVRKSDARTAIDVTPLFTPLVNHISLDELRDYVLRRYVSSSGQGIDENRRPIKYELIEIGDSDLKAFNPAFNRADSLRIVFAYEDDQKKISRLKAVLLNGLL